MKVKQSNRIGYTAGCWKITRAQALTLTGNRLPSIGCERQVKEQQGQVCNESRTQQFSTVFRAWVENRAGQFIVRDENLILNLEEVK